MSGKPAARQGDMTQYGGSIVQGSAGVRIGAPTGVACSVCPGGVTSGHPVNPLLGAKVLPGETDIALPGPLPFILSRTYSSYRTRTPAPVGVYRIRPRQGYPPFGGVADARPGIPGEPARCATGAVHVYGSR